MLVLSREKGEELIIGDNIRIVIRSITKDRVRIAIDAPSHVRVLRGELAEKEGGSHG